MTWQTVVVLAVLVGIVTAIILSMIRNKKKGKRCCGAACGGCSMRGICHANASDEGSDTEAK